MLWPMSLRKLPVRPSMRAWIDYPCFSYAEEGWPAGTSVTVVSRTGEGYLVRDDHGHEIELPHWSLCTGYEYRSRDGRWFPECHPAVLDHLERELAKKQAETWQNEDSREGCIRFILAVLERNCRLQAVRAQEAATPPRLPWFAGHIAPGAWLP